MGVNYNPFSLEGKTILVTGASSGIGRATAIECSRLGASLVIVGRNKERLQETFDMLDVKEGNVQILADLTKSEDILKIALEIPILDGLVNNAGVGHTSLIRFITQNDADFVFQNNTFAPILLTKEILKKKKISKGGSIVFTSSIAPFTNSLGHALYSASKAAISSYMRTCARELADKQIRANAICPGMIETKLIKDGALSDEDLQKDMDKYPLKRYGKPEEVAYSIVYLLSDATKWMTGSSIVLDGGCTL